MYLVDSTTFDRDLEVKARYNDEEFTVRVLATPRLYDMTGQNDSTVDHLWALIFESDISQDLPNLSQLNQIQWWAKPDNLITAGGHCFYCMMQAPNDGVDWVSCQFNDKYVLNLFTSMNGVDFANVYTKEQSVLQDLLNIQDVPTYFTWKFHKSNRPDVSLTLL